MTKILQPKDSVKFLATQDWKIHDAQAEWSVTSLLFNNRKFDMFKINQKINKNQFIQFTKTKVGRIPYIKQTSKKFFHREALDIITAKIQNFSN